MTDKQAAATFATNDFLSEAEIDAENDLESSFILEKKLRSSGADPASPTYPPEISASRKLKLKYSSSKVY